MVSVDDITVEKSLQVRARLDKATLDDYQLAIQADDTFPPVILFDDGTALRLADGFHRLAASRRLGCLEIEATVLKGSRGDALRYALTANNRHGLRMTNADKRRAVRLAYELMLESDERWSASDVADMTGVSQPTVSKVREEMEGEGSSFPETVTGKDGRVRKAKAPRPQNFSGGDSPESQLRESPPRAVSGPAATGDDYASVALGDLAKLAADHADDDPRWSAFLDSLCDWIEKERARVARPRIDGIEPDSEIPA